MIEELVKGLILAVMEILTSDASVEEKADALDATLVKARTDLRTGVEEEIAERTSKLDAAVPRD